MLNDPRKYYERARDLSGKLGTKAAGRALVIVILGILLVFWAATEYEAARFDFQPALGRPSLGEAIAAPFGYVPRQRSLLTEIEDPVGWARWEWKWSWQPWVCSQVPARLCRPLYFSPRARAFKDATFAGGHHILIGGGVAFLVAFGALRIWRKRRPRELSEKDRPLIYGSARWANREEMLRYAVGHYTALQRLLRAFGIKRARQIGFVLGKFVDKASGAIYQLRTDNRPPRGAVVLGISGSGKTACVITPSLLQYPESAIIYDPSFELVFTTAGAREQVLNNDVHIIAPTLPEDNEFGIVSDCINPYDAIRWGTLHEVGDLQSHTALMLDPSDKAAEGAEAHWIVCGKALGDCTALFKRYSDPKSCTYRGQKEFLADPSIGDSVDAAFDKMLSIPLDPELKYGWKDLQGRPSVHHPHVLFNASMIKRKPAAEKGSVVSTFLRFLDPYDDPLLARITSHSTILFDDLMNGRRPQSWYFCLPERDVQRLRLWFRTTLGMATRVQMGEGAITYVNNEPVARARHRLGLYIDEARQLGPQELLFMLFSATRKYKVFPVLGFQDYGQVEEVAGKAGISNLPYKIFFAPDSEKTAEWMSKQIGTTTTVRETETVSGPRFGMQRVLGLGLNVSSSIDLRARRLADPDELMRMDPDTAVVKITNESPMYVRRFYYKSDPELLRRSLIPIPTGKRHTLRDRIIPPLIPNPVSPGGVPLTPNELASRARDVAGVDRPAATSPTGLPLRAEDDTRSPEEKAKAAASSAAGVSGPPADRRSAARPEGGFDRRDAARPEAEGEPQPPPERSVPLGNPPRVADRRTAARPEGGSDRRDGVRPTADPSRSSRLSASPARIVASVIPGEFDEAEDEEEQLAPVGAPASVDAGEAAEMRPAQPAAVSTEVLRDDQLQAFLSMAAGAEEPNGEDASGATITEAMLHEHHDQSDGEFEIENDF